MEGTKSTDVDHKAETALCFSIGAPYCGHVVQNSSTSSSPACISDTPWDTVPSLETKLHYEQNKPLSSPSSVSSSSSPIDLTASSRKPPSSSARISPQLHTLQNFPLQTHPGSAAVLLYSKQGQEDSFHSDMDSENSTTETAQILYNMSTVAFQNQKSADQRQQGRPKSPLPGSALPSNSPPTPLTPPPLSQGICQRTQNAELLCGVCHRLFSTAVALSVHMRLHRGGRALSCQHCGKVFIHNKRLQSHEATCRQATPSLSVLTKQEPVEEEEKNVLAGGKGEEEAEPEQMGSSQRMKKERSMLGRHQRSYPRTDLRVEDDHFVKVVDGHIIYFCAVCERSYMTLSSLKRHSNVHSWRRKYPCRYCDKVFALAEYRTKHEVWHTGERRYQCIFCWETFATYYNLKTHQKGLHGINPGLITSEKTANGGYKQKVNALKLYRLLPMRSQKRPYKTYSHSLADSLLVPPSSSVPLTLPLNCSLSTSIGPSELHSLIGDTHPGNIQPDSSKLPYAVSSASLDQAESLRPSLEESIDKMGEKSNEASEDNDLTSIKGSVSSVITFGHPQTSVIVHGTSVSSSVIVHSNQISSEASISISNSSSPETSSIPLSSKVTTHPMKKHVLKEYIQAQKIASLKAECSTIAEKQENKSVVGEERGRSLKGCKSHSQSITYTAKPACVAEVSEIRGVAPLCQITVRIGEEAIVKRSISEMDLMRDKNPPLSSKSRKNDTTPPNSTAAEHKHHHHHHRHKHRMTRDTNDQAERETKRKYQKTPKPPGKVREYYFRQEVREEDSDQDAEDNLWRPYYSYKPKRKGMHVHKVKKASWQRKLRYKRSLRLIKRAEKLMDYSAKDDDENDEDGQQDEWKREDELREEQHSTDASTVSSLSGNGRDMEGEPREKLSRKDAHPWTLSHPVCDSLCTSSTQLEEVLECSTCGRQFSSVRKRDKHELTHLLEFVCMVCRESFSSQTRLEKHQRSQHLGAEPQLPLSQRQTLNMDMELEKEGLAKGSLGRVGRRPSVRHTCTYCAKVCKTAAALGRHTKRHEPGSLAANEEIDCEPFSPEKGMPSSGELAVDVSKVKTEYNQSTPVISYPISVSQTNKCESQSLCQAGVPEMKIHTFQTPSLVSDHNAACPCKEPPSSAVVTSSSPYSVLVPSMREIVDEGSCLRTCTEKSPPSKERRPNWTERPAQKQGQTDTFQGLVTKRQIKTDPAEEELKNIISSRSVARAESSSDLGINALNSEVGNCKEAGDFQAVAQAQDLTMPSILAREQSNTRKEMPLLIPKREVESPVLSPDYSANGLPKRLHRSPHSSPHSTDISPHIQPESLSTTRRSQGVERSGLLQLSSSSRVSDRPSAHALLLPRMPPAETKPEEDLGEATYTAQEFPLPLIVPQGCRSSKKPDDNILMSYPASTIPFAPLGKIGASDLAKLPFYPDPYHLLYGPHLLPYPYSLAALPMALNMMAPGEKVEPVPILPALFNYGMGPYMGAAAHPLVANPSHYSSSSSGKQKDSSDS